MKINILRIILTAIAVFLLFGSLIGAAMAAYTAMPTWLMIAIPIITIPSICYFVFNKFFNKEIPEGQTGNFFQRNKITTALGVVLGSVMSGFFTLSSLESDLTIDNGTKKSVKVEYYARTKDFLSVDIPAGSFKEITLPKGDNVLTLNGEKKIVKMLGRNGKQIYNIDKINNYVLLEVDYGSEAPPKELKTFNSTEFFQVNADYLFEAPESIVTRRRSSKKKQVLLRTNNTDQ
jgi:hypothetical protein